MNDDAKVSLAKYEPKQVKVLKTKRQVFAARYSPCGKYLLSGGFDSLIYRWDTSSDEMQELPPLEGHGGWTQATAFNAPMKTLLTADSWGKLMCWQYEAEKPQPKWTVDAAHDGWIREIAVSPDGKRVATCGDDHKIIIWSADDGKRMTEFAGQTEVVFCLRFHPDGKSLVSGDLKGIVRQWDIATGKKTREFDAGVLFTLHRLQDVGGVRCLTFDPDGKTLLAAGTKPKNGGNVQGTPTILFFDWQSGKLNRALEVGQSSDVYVSDIQFHPGGFLIVSTCGGPGTGKLMLQRTEDDAAFFTKKLPNCHAVSLHPSGLRFAVTTTNAGSNGNGRRVDKEGNYIGNTSPIHIFDLPDPNVKPAEADSKSKKTAGGTSFRKKVIVS